MGFDKLDFRFVQTVFFIKLLVDFGDGFCPVNVGGGREVFESDVFPFLLGIVLRCFQNTLHNPLKFRFDVFQCGLCFLFGFKCAYTEESFC